MFEWLTIDQLIGWFCYEIATANMFIFLVSSVIISFVHAFVFWSVDKGSLLFSCWVPAALFGGLFLVLTLVLILVYYLGACT